MNEIGWYRFTAGEGLYIFASDLSCLLYFVSSSVVVRSAFAKALAGMLAEALAKAGGGGGRDFRVL